MSRFRETPARRWRAVPKQILPLGILTICGWLLIHRLEGLDIVALRHAFVMLELYQWGLALLATALSFLALARYDVIAHRHFQTGIPAHSATIVGATAVALGQTLGAGVVVGSFLRWRLHPNLSLIDAARISGFVAIAFVASLSILIAASTILVPAASSV